MEEGMRQNSDITDHLHTTIKTFVFIDLETSSLISMERPKIMELCMIAVHRDALLLSSMANQGAVVPGLPRVIDKLNLCIWPGKPISEKSFQLTGLDNYNLQQSQTRIFDIDAATMLRLFLSRHEAPICLVAHNGDGFDFRLLRTELGRISYRLDSEILCSDSLKCYAEITDGEHGDVRVSYKLGEIYRRTFCEAMPGAHNAESDVVALTKIFLSRAEKMCGWMDKNARKFNDVELYYVPSPPRKNEHLKNSHFNSK